LSRTALACGAEDPLKLLGGLDGHRAKAALTFDGFHRASNVGKLAVLLSGSDWMLPWIHRLRQDEGGFLDISDMSAECTTFGGRHSI
jgi:hypothetical protein